MKLTKAAILTIKGSSQETKRRIMEAAGISGNTFYKWVATNDRKLTQAGIVQIIKEESGLSEGELLEPAQAIEAIS